jgi:hypothetical protein
MLDIIYMLFVKLNKFEHIDIILFLMRTTACSTFFHNIVRPKCLKFSLLKRVIIKKTQCHCGLVGLGLPVR